MDRFVGKTLPVLVEERVENEDGLYIGRTVCQAPEVDGATVLSSDYTLTPGTIVSARPSGTEPKIKFYATCCAEVGKDGLEAAKKVVAGKLAAIEKDLRAVIGD